MNRMSARNIISTLALLLWAPSAVAQSPACDQLGGDGRALAAEILGSEYLHACCDGTVLKCLQREPVCPLAIRISENICRRVAAGQDRERISRALNRRARTILDIEFRKPRTFDLTNAAWAGEPEAPIALVEFASARGPHCARMTPPIYRAVVDGRLKGKVRLFLKHFPLRSNPYSKQTALAFLAAGDKGKLWDLVLLSYAHFDEFTPERLGEWAGDLGLDRAEFEAAMEDPRLRKRLGADKLEGVEAGVNSTPTFFIDGHQYKGELDADELVDVLEEVYEMKE